MSFDISTLPPLTTLLVAALIGAVAAVPAQYFMARFEAHYRLPLLVPLFALMGTATCAMTDANPRALVLLVAALVLLTATLIDLKVRRLPDLLTGSLFVFAMGASLLGYGPAPLDALIGAAIGFGSLLGLNLLYQLLRGRNGVGGGDIKLALGLGALTALPDVVLVLAGGAILHAIIGVGLIVARRSTLASELPFGPALSVVTWLLLITAPPLA